MWDQRKEHLPTLFTHAGPEASASERVCEDVHNNPEKRGKKISNAHRRLFSEFALKMTRELLTEGEAKGEGRGGSRVGSTARNPDGTSKQEEPA